MECEEVEPRPFFLALAVLAACSDSSTEPLRANVTMQGLLVMNVTTDPRTAAPGRKPVFVDVAASPTSDAVVLEVWPCKNSSVRRM